MADFAPYDQLSSRLFRLPAELRNEIYHHVLCVPNALVWNYAPRLQHAALKSAETSENKSERDARTRHLDLSEGSGLPFLLTCRRINHEAAGIFYNTHPWYLDGKAFVPPSVDFFCVNQPLPQDFVYTLSQERLNGMHTITVEVSSAEELVHVVKGLQHMPRLRQLTFVLKGWGFAGYIGPEMSQVWRTLSTFGGLEKLEVKMKHSEFFGSEKRFEKVKGYLGQVMEDFQVEGDGGACGEVMDESEE